MISPLAIDGINLEKPIIIAGPCSAESEQQLLSTARGLAAAGVKIFRAGIWKPRTKPGGFEGIGLPGLEWMKKVKESTGMHTATEVATRAHAEAALDAGIDILWLGARTTANPFAVQEIADTIAAMNRTDVPVLVKNPMSPDLDLWIGAIERLTGAGITRVAAIHRGFSTWDGGHKETRLYRNEPLWRIPLELRRLMPDLPIIADPSHMGGKRELIAPLSQQALDMGLDGLIIETHSCPDCALSDKDQQITPASLGVILDNLVYRDTVAPTDSLADLRRQIDRLDHELLEVLAKRMNVSREIGRYKKERKMPVVQPGRYDDVMQSRIAAARAMGIGEDFMRLVLAAIHEESVRLQL